MLEGLIDWPCIIAALLTVVLGFWRVPILYNKLRQSATGSSNISSLARNEKLRSHKWSTHARKACLKQFGQVFVDIPFILAAIIVFCTGWRTAPLVSGLISAKREDRDRDRDIDRARLAELEKKVLSPQQRKSHEAAHANVPSMGAQTHLKNLLVEDNAVRAELAALRATLGKTTWRKVCMTQLYRLGVDVFLSIPALIVFVTLWRAVPLYKFAKKRALKLEGKSKGCFQDALLFKNGAVILQQFGRLCLDFVLALMSLVVYATLWRFFPLLKKTKKKIRKLKGIKKKKTPTAASDGVDDKGDTNSSKEPTETAVMLFTAPPTSTKVTKTEFVFQDAVLTKNAKNIVIQFGLLLVDLIVFPLALLLLFTWRSKAFVSGLVGSGDFYGLFAVTVVTEFVRFLVDIPCIFWFSVMVMLRPIGAVTLLLEDAKHRKRRELLLIRGEMRDILNQRHEQYQKLDDIVDAALRIGVEPRGFVKTSSTLVTYGDGSKRMGQRDYFVPLFAMDEAMEPYLTRLKRHKEATAGMSDTYTHLITQIEFIESKRSRKMMRGYHSEWIFMCRPNIECHAHNTELVRKEMDAFNQSSAQAFKELFEYKPPSRPLWSRETGWSSRTRQQTRKVLLNIATTGYFATLFLFLVNCIPLYRMPLLVSQLYNHWWNRHVILRTSIAEYAKDFSAVTCMVLVTCAVMHAIPMYGDMYTAVTVDGSWTLARKVAFKAVRNIGHDIFDVLKLPLQWSSYVFVILSLVWGVLVPIDLFQPAFGVVGAILFWLLFTSAPFVFSAHFAATISDPFVVNAVIAGFLGFLILILIITAKRCKEKSFARPAQFKFFRVNSDNIMTMVSELLEFLQIAALTLQIGIPMYFGSEARDVAGYFLFSFIPTDIMFWLMIVVFVIWYFVASAPTILEDVMKKLEKGRLSQHVMWQFAVRFFTDTLFITMAEACLQMVKCQETQVENIFIDLENVTQTENITQVQLVGLSSVECWQGSHQILGGFALYILMWYTVTGILFNAYFRVSSSSHDFEFSSLYLILINLLKLAMTGVATLLSDYKLIAVVLLGVLNLVAAVLTAIFSRFTGYAACNAFIPLAWKVGAFVATTWLSICAVVALQVTNIDPSIPPILCLAGWSVLVIGLIIYTVLKYKPTDLETARGKFKTKILSLQAKLEMQGAMLNCESRVSSAWKTKLKNVREAQWVSMETHTEINYIQHVNGDLVCPITMELFEDPVRSPYGHHFEKAAIEQWLKSNKTCPLTRQPLTQSQLKHSDSKILKDLRQLAIDATLPRLLDNPFASNMETVEVFVEKIVQGRWMTPSMVLQQKSETEAEAKLSNHQRDSISTSDGLDLTNAWLEGSDDTNPNALIRGNSGHYGFSSSSRPPSISPNSSNEIPDDMDEDTNQLEQGFPTRRRSQSYINVTQDLTTNPENLTTNPEDLTTNPEDLTTNPENLTSNPTSDRTPTYPLGDATMKPIRKKRILPPTPRSDSAAKYVAADLDGGVTQPDEPSSRETGVNEKSATRSNVLLGTDAEHVADCTHDEEVAFALQTEFNRENNDAISNDSNRLLGNSMTPRPPPTTTDTMDATRDTMDAIPLSLPPPQYVPDPTQTVAVPIGLPPLICGTKVLDVPYILSIRQKLVKKPHPLLAVLRMLEGKSQQDQAYDGRSVLLDLELRIRYNWLSFKFLSGREDWIEGVKKSSWIGLLECATRLEEALNAQHFAAPPMQLRCEALASDLLEPDWDEINLPPFVNRENESEEEIKERSRAQRLSLMTMVESRLGQGHHLFKLFEKLFPLDIVDTFEVVDGIVKYGDPTKTTTTVNINFVHDGRGKITAVDEKAGGVALAKGAQIRWQESVEMDIDIDQTIPCISFRKGNVKAGKGPVTVTINKISYVNEGEFMIDYNKGKVAKGNVHKVLSSLLEIQWS